MLSWTLKSPALMLRLLDAQLQALREVEQHIVAIERELVIVATPAAQCPSALREVPGLGLLGATALAATLGRWNWLAQRARVRLHAWV